MFISFTLGEGNLELPSKSKFVRFLMRGGKVYGGKVNMTLISKLSPKIGGFGGIRRNGEVDFY